MPEPERKPVRLDLGGFKPKPAMEQVSPVQEREAAAVAKDQGFAARPVEKLDGRTLRKKGKTQMNMRVSERVRNAFLQISTQFSDADACLSHLIELYQASRRGQEP